MGLDDDIVVIGLFHRALEALDQRCRHHVLPTDLDAPLGVDVDIDILLILLFSGLALGRKVYVQPLGVDEDRGDHEENQQQENAVDQRRQIEPFVFQLFDYRRPRHHLKGFLFGKSNAGDIGGFGRIHHQNHVLLRAIDVGLDDDIVVIGFFHRAL